MTTSLADEEASTEVYVSPTAVYRNLHVGNGSSEDCDNNICSVSYRFSRIASTPCNVSFVCTKLTGDPCAEYQIGVTFNDEDRQKYCYGGEAYLGLLETDEYVDVDLWYVDKSEFKAECFLWCADDGPLPEQLASDIKEDLVLSLV